MDRIVEMQCPCCGRTYRISVTNIRRIARAAALRFHLDDGEEVEVMLSEVPEDLDLIGNMSAADVARVVRLAVTPKAWP